MLIILQYFGYICIWAWDFGCWILDVGILPDHLYHLPSFPPFEYTPIIKEQDETRTYSYR